MFLINKNAFLDLIAFILYGVDFCRIVLFVFRVQRYSQIALVRNLVTPVKFFKYIIPENAGICGNSVSGFCYLEK